MWQRIAALQGGTPRPRVALAGHIRIRLRHEGSANRTGDALLGYLPAANISARSLLLLLTYHTIKITGLQQVTASCVGDTAPPPWPVTPAADKREVPEFIVYYHVHNGQ